MASLIAVWPGGLTTASGAAVLAGVSPRQVSAWIRGRRLRSYRRRGVKMVKLSAVKRLARGRGRNPRRSGRGRKRRWRKLSRIFRRGYAPNRCRVANPAECQLCGGPLVLLGQLGSRLHLRCQDCGMMYSKVIRLRKQKRGRRK